MILITGASSGIGEATAREFAKRGRRLILCARRKDRLEKLAKELGPGAQAVELDVSDAKAVDEFFNKNKKLLESVEVLVNSAGLAIGLDPFQKSELKDWETTLKTNVMGLVRMTQGMLLHFMAKKRGHIINLGSVAGRWAYPKGGAYCASKAAVASFTQTLRMDLLGTNIRVTELQAGMVETDFSRIRFHGDEARAKSVYAGLKPLTGQDMAEILVWCVERPAHVNIQEVVIYPTAQASPTLAYRGT